MKLIYIVYSSEEIFGLFTDQNLANECLNQVNEMYALSGSYIRAEIKKMYLNENKMER